MLSIFKPHQNIYNWRFELKYHIPFQQYLAIRNALVPYMKQDEYTQPSGRYIVRSLYYDSDDYQAYYEKIGGDYGRIKLRIRSYSDKASEAGLLKVELKTKFGTSMEKYSTFVTREDYEYFLAKNHWPKTSDQVLMEFERLYHLRALKPKVLLDYRREGYNCRDGSSLRLTFDHQVKSASSSSLFPDPVFFRNHYGHSTIILEIKCQGKQPAWLAAIVRQQGLRFIANSKYVQAIEISRPDVINCTAGYYYPEKVVPGVDLPSAGVKRTPKASVTK